MIQAGDSLYYGQPDHFITTGPFCPTWHFVIEHEGLDELEVY